jgi:DNA-binding transcriptional MerR regulator
MSSYSIRDLEQLSGIKAHTLRIWEQRYQLIKPNRSDTNIRNYDTTQLKLILNVALLRNHGLKISEIAKCSNEQIESKVSVISSKQLNYPDQIQALTNSMLELNEDKFEEILNSNIEKFGFENVMLNIVYPFLSKIGILWITGAIGPAQEHFMSSLIRQKLYVAIDGLSKPIGNNHKTIVLFLPEGEYHDIGLLFANYILNDLTFATDYYKADFIFTAITSSPNAEKVQAFLDNISEKFEKISIFVTGYQVINKKLSFAKNVTLISTVEELQKIVNWF